MQANRIARVCARSVRRTLGWSMFQLSTRAASRSAALLDRQTPLHYVATDLAEAMGRVDRDAALGVDNHKAGAATGVGQSGPATPGGTS